MPEFVTSRLREGFRYFGKVSRGFLTNEATMIGVETPYIRSGSYPP